MLKRLREALYLDLDAKDRAIIDKSAKQSETANILRILHKVGLLNPEDSNSDINRNLVLNFGAYARCAEITLNKLNDDFATADKLVAQTFFSNYAQQSRPEAYILDCYIDIIHKAPLLPVENRLANLNALMMHATGRTGAQNAKFVISLMNQDCFDDLMKYSNILLELHASFNLKSIFEDMLPTKDYGELMTLYKKYLSEIFTIVREAKDESEASQSFKDYAEQVLADKMLQKRGLPHKQMFFPVVNPNADVESRLGYMDQLFKPK